MRIRRDLDVLTTKAYFIEVGTSQRLVNARKSDNFTELAMTALLEIVPRGHHYSTSLDTIYMDLLDAHFIAERARPITMEGMSFGEWVRWYEINIMPTLKKSNESGSTTTDCLWLTLAGLSILALTFTVGALPALIVFSQLATIIRGVL